MKVLAVHYNISSHLGLWRYKRLSFGINSAAEFFQNANREAFSDIAGVEHQR